MESCASNASGDAEAAAEAVSRVGRFWITGCRCEISQENTLNFGGKGLVYFQYPITFAEVFCSIVRLLLLMFVAHLFDYFL